MGAADALVEHGGVPGQVEVHDRRGGLEVEAQAPGVGREEHEATRVAHELVDEAAALAQRKAAVEAHVADPELVQLARRELGHPLPAGEDEGLSPALDQLGEELAELLELGGEVRLLVEDPGGVAEHALPS
jgi:hypothetical protein